MEDNHKKKNSKPIFFVVVAFIVQLVQLIVENITEEYANIVTNSLKISIELKLTHIILFVAVGYWIVSIKIEGYKKEIDSLNKLLEEDVRKLMGKYKELADFKLKQDINNSIVDFLDKQEDVYAAQIYKYTVKNKLRYKEVKVNFLTGEASEGYDLSARYQIYYRIDKKLYYKFIRACEELFNCKKGKQPTLILKFIEEGLQVLLETKINELDEGHCIIYALTTLAMEYAKDIIDNEEIKLKLEEYKEYLAENKIISTLYTQKKTGILQGIINNDIYYFRNLGDSKNKKGRIYLSKTIKINKKAYIFLLIINRDIIKEKGYLDMFELISDDFIDELKSKHIDVEPTK